MESGGDRFGFSDMRADFAIEFLKWHGDAFFLTFAPPPCSPREQS